MSAPPDPLPALYVDLAAATGGFVHDLKNHLGTVLLHLQLLDEDFDEPQTHRERRAVDRVRQMADECRRLVALSNDFLRFVRVDELHADPVDFADAVGRMIDFVAPSAASKNITVAWHPAPDLPPVPLDRELFERVLLNLLLNAEDAMPDGGTLTLQARAEDGRVALDVIDTGCGMPADVLTKLFKPFHTTKPGGNGLGLATARRIMHAHGGTIAVQSEPGRGTKFTLRLPTGGMTNDPPMARETQSTNSE